MTLDQLVAFIAVVETGSFRAAGARLHKSQPSISKLVRNLEDSLAIELLDRRGYRPVPSPEGAIVVERARALVQAAQALEGLGAQLAGETEVAVRLAVELLCPLAPILAGLRHVRRRFPGVRIELTTEALGGAGRKLAQEEVDLAIASRVPRGFETTPFWAVEVVPVARAGHPLAEVAGPIPVERLVEHPQIVLRDDEPTQAINVLDGGHRWRVDDLATKHELIRAGMGWGGLPRHVVARGLERGTLVALDVAPFDTSTIRLALARRPEARGPAASALYGKLAEEARP